MMIVVVAACGLLATLLAALCAYAEGALLAIEGPLDGSAPPLVRGVVERRERVHRALAFGRIGAQLLAGAVAAATLKVSGVPAEQIAPAVLAVGLLLVVVAESTARVAGDDAGAVALAGVGPFVVAVEHLLQPIVTVGVWCDALLLRLLPLRPDDDVERDAVEQFQDVVSGDGGLDSKTTVLLRGVFSLNDTAVQEIMAPRVDIVGVDRNATWGALVDRVRSARHSRLVVYEGTLDEVVGVLCAKDLLPFVLQDTEPTGGWLHLVQPASFIPATKSVEAQLRDFKSSRRHLAVVVDEYGGTAGLVTLEDVLEVIVGEIRDEHDMEEPEIVRETDDRLWVSARVSLDELSELVGYDFRRDGVRTVGGLVYELAGRVPRGGETLTVGAFRLVVERVVRRRVERVFLERIREPRRALVEGAV